MNSSSTPTLPGNEIVRLGREIYRQQILPLIETSHRGAIVAIDVDSGEWATDESVRLAVRRLKEKQPHAVNILSERVGYPALYHFGGRPLRKTKC